MVWLRLLPIHTLCALCVYVCVCPPLGTEVEVMKCSLLIQLEMLEIHLHTYTHTQRNTHTHTLTHTFQGHLLLCACMHLRINVFKLRGDTTEHNCSNLIVQQQTPDVFSLSLHAHTHMLQMHIKHQQGYLRLSWGVSSLIKMHSCVAVSALSKQNQHAHTLFTDRYCLPWLRKCCVVS